MCLVSGCLSVCQQYASKPSVLQWLAFAGESMGLEYGRRLFFLNNISYGTFNAISFLMPRIDASIISKCSANLGYMPAAPYE